MEPIVVSNSEVTTFLGCMRKHFFAFEMGLEPVNTNKALERGTIGHEILSKVAQAIKDGTHKPLNVVLDEALQSAMQNYPLELVLEVSVLVTNYLNRVNWWADWEILGTEDELHIPLNEQVHGGMRYDLLIRERATGRVYVVDFKFTYDFWSPHDHEINGQMPKYITFMRILGYVIDGGLLEEIRTRKLSAKSQNDPSALWRRTAYHPTKARTRTMLRHHVAVSLRIADHRALPLQERFDRSLPVLDKYGSCQFCDFASLCTSAIEGAALDELGPAIRENYKHNTYLYE